MPKRHSCQNFEARTDCEEPRCFHCDDETQYLFDTITQALFYTMLPLECQMMILALLDIGYDKRDPQDNLE